MDAWGLGDMDPTGGDARPCVLTPKRLKLGKPPINRNPINRNEEAVGGVGLARVSVEGRC